MADRSSLAAPERGSARPALARERASDEELVAKILADGDTPRARAAFSELVQRHHARLFGFLIHRTASAHDAEDAAQEAFVLAWRRLETFRRGMKFATWLFAIGIRCCATAHRRKAARQRAEHQAIAPPRPSALIDSTDNIELGRRLWTIAQRELTPEHFDALWLRYVEGMEPAEIALVLGRTGVGVRVALLRARRRLADLARDHHTMQRKATP